MQGKLSLIASIIALVFVLPVKASEPQISFVVKNRWVKFTLTHDETPVTNRMVRVFDAFGNTFAEGETGANGQGEFPLPSGHHFKIEIKIGERTADLIPVTSIGGNRVVPNRVLLSFGLAPCCRIVSRGVVEKQTATVLSPHEPSDKKEIGSNPWIPAIGALILLLAGTCLVLLAFRPSTSTENTLAKEMS